MAQMSKTYGLADSATAAEYALKIKNAVGAAAGDSASNPNFGLASLTVAASGSTVTVETSLTGDPAFYCALAAKHALDNA